MKPGTAAKELPKEEFEAICGGPVSFSASKS